MKKRILFMTAPVVTAVFTLTLILWLLIPKSAYAANHTVGGVCGSTIQACINFAAPGDTVIIPDGIYNENVVLDKGVSLQGASRAGTIIDAGGAGRGMLVTGTAVLSDTIIENLTIRNGDVSGGNVCSDQFNLTNCGGGVLIAGGAYPTLRNLLISSNAAHDGGGIFVERDGGVWLDGVEIADNVSTQVGGGGVFHGETTMLNSRFVQNQSGNAGGGASVSATFPGYPKFAVMISGTEFISNTAICTAFSCFLDGGGLRVFELDLEIVNSRFENNRCSESSGDCAGGGLAHSQAFNQVSLTLSNTDFISNSAQYAGGGVSFDATFSDTAQVMGGQFVSNTLVGTTATFFGGEGGGLYVRDASTQMTGTQFVGNTAFRLGGGFYSLAPGTAEINSAQFQSNEVISGSGGGIAIDFIGALTMNDTILVSNTAVFNGGGLYTASPTSISGGRFEGNRSLGGDSSGDLEGGGGLFATQSVTLTNVNLIGNIANLNGGGVMIWNNHALQIDGGRFERNEAWGQGPPSQRGGGGLYVWGDVTVVGTVFVSNTAVLTNSFNDLNVGGAGHVVGTAVLDQVQVSGNAGYASGGGFFVSNGAAVSDAVFSGNEATSFDGGGLYVTGDATISGGSFTNNRTGRSGGGLLVNQGDLTLTGTSFSGNTADFSGGGLSLFGGVGGATVTINTASFQNNAATSNSGGGAFIFAGIGSVTTLNDTIFSSNGAGLSGGALYLDSGTINGGMVSQNNAVNGGGIAASGLLQINGTTITGNTAVGDGGGINSNSDVIIDNGLVQNNASTGGSGGGVWGNSAVIMNDTQVLSNTAVLDGGGAYARLGFNTAMDRVLFDNNTAGHAGGGLFVGRRLALSQDTRFINNQAQLGGGLAISNTSGTTGMEMVNNLFSRNVATGDGAAIYLQSPRPLNVVHTTIGDTAVNGQEAIYVLNATLSITNSIVASHTTGIANVGGTVTSIANVYFGNTVNESGAVASSNIVLTNPLFVNPANDDYRLVIGSSAIDNGVDAGVTTDILGQTRPINGIPDRGAYEGPHTPTAVSLNQFSATTTNSWGWLLTAALLLTLFTTLFWRWRTM